MIAVGRLKIHVFDEVRRLSVETENLETWLSARVAKRRGKILHKRHRHNLECA